MNKTPHKHCEVIKAWAEGLETEVEITPGVWRLVGSSPSWNDVNVYRIKPEPKPDVIRYGVANYIEQWADVKFLGPNNQRIDNNIKLTFDGETNKLIKAEVI